MATSRVNREVVRAGACVRVCVRAHTYECEEVEYVVAVRAHHVEGHAAELHEVLEALRGTIAAVDHVRHVVSQHERSPIPKTLRFMSSA